MKQLSEMQKNLIQCLKYLKLEEDAIVVIMLSLKEEDQMAELADFLMNNQESTQGQILEKVMEISAV